MDNDMATQAQKSLGEVLKSARQLSGYALRTLEEMTGISNAYLSQLENDKIKKPAADILYKLSDVFKIDFNYLMEVAGLVKRKPSSSPSLGEFVFSKENLTTDEEQELMEYLKFIRQRKK